MNSFFSLLSASLLEIWSDILDIADQLHTGSIEFTVTREEGVPIGLEVRLQCLLAEQKQDPLTRIPKKDVKEDKKIGHIY